MNRTYSDKDFKENKDLCTQSLLCSSVSESLVDKDFKEDKDTLTSYSQLHITLFKHEIRTLRRIRSSVDVF